MDDFELFHKKEFGQLIPNIREKNKISEDIDIIKLEKLPQERWHFSPKSTQIFAKNYTGPRSVQTRTYFKHATGVGKTLLGHLVGHEYIKLPNTKILVLGFTNTKEVFWNDALKYPELGFVSYIESKHYRDLEIKFLETRSMQDYQVYQKYYLQLRGRLIHKRKGGRYTFLGYQEFANQLGFYDDNNTYEDIDNRKMTKSAKYFLESLTNTLIIADEFHQCYNKDGFNNRGMAIYFTLKYHQSNIRFIATSATPFRKSALESIYLAKILHAGTGTPSINRDDYFNKSSSAVIDKQGLLKLFRGKVSYAPIKDISLFPVKIWAPNSEPLKNIDRNEFLFIKCKMTKEHASAAKTIRINSSKFNTTYIDDIHEIHVDHADHADLMYIGNIYIPDLIKSHSSMPPELNKYISKWLENKDVSKLTNDDYLELSMDSAWINMINKLAPSDNERSIEVQWINDLYIPSIMKYGNIKFYPELEKYLAEWLGGKTFEPKSKHYKELAQILPKDAQWLEDLDTMYGKIITCHPRIRGGILRLEQILRAKGWITDNEKPSKLTPCAVCNIEYEKHKKYKSDLHIKINENHEEKITDHEYKPSVYLVIHSDLDESTKSRVKSLFNAESNIAGTQYKMLIGGELIATGYDNKGVKHICLLSMLDSYEIILQLHGRGIRNGSHTGLPYPEWYCMIHNYVLVDNDDWTPELYQVEYPEHLNIKEVNEGIDSVAFDIVLSDIDMRKVFDQSVPKNKLGADLETYYMHELFTDEISTLVYIIKKLFLYQTC